MTVVRSPSPIRSETTPKNRRRPRLSIEALDDRIAPATFYASPGVADGDSGSLRAALIAAQQLTEHSDIILDSGTYHLTLGTLQISSSDLAVEPAIGAQATVEQDTANQSVFDIAGGAVVLQGLGITGGHSPADGGGIDITAGTVTIAGCDIFSNFASGDGGGISNLGALTVENSNISNNSAGFNTGGIENRGGVPLSILNCTITNNTCGNGGGGVGTENSGGPTIIITDCTISGNSANGGGGGISTGQPMAIDGCVIANNSTNGYGGGINNGVATSIRDTTISGNMAGGYGGGVENGGRDGNLTMASCTVTGNSAASGGGIDHGSIGGPSVGIAVMNSVVAGNTSSNGPDIHSSYSVNTSFCLIGNTGGYTEGNGAGNLAPGTAPMLGPLQDNGGLTFTMALLPGSPLIDAGSNSLVPADLTTDQRGGNFVRIFGSAVDIGAFEAQAATPAVTVDPAQPDPTNIRSPVVFDVNFNQPVTGFSDSQIDLTGSTATGNLVASIAGSGANYTVSVTGATSDGTVSVAVKAGTGAEGLNASGQNNLASPAPATVTIDTVGPTVTINQDSTQNDPTNSTTIKFDVVFSEQVVGFDGTKVALSGTAGGTLSASVAAGAGPNSYVVSVTGMTSPGTVVANIPANEVTDLAGNGNLASTSTDNTVTFDNVSPSVTINQGAGQSDPTGGISIVFDVVFSEAVVGFDGTKVDLTASTAPGTLVASVSGSGPAYSVTVMGMTGSGLIAASIDAGVVTDLAGNPNLASTGSDNLVSYIHAGTVQFSAPTYSIDEQGAPSLTITATRTGGSDDSLSIDYATSSGSAVAGIDFTATSGTLNWAAGDTTNKTFMVPILDDGGLETDRAFTVGLTGTSLPGALGTPATATVNILETAALSLSVANYAVNESDGSAIITVQRLFGSDGAVSVHYAASDGSATSPSDYTATSGTLNWADGDSAVKTFSVPIVNDNLSEGNEKFNLTLSAPAGNAELGPQSTATVLIAKSHGITINGNAKKPQSTFTDIDGDLVTVRLAGKVGTLTYYLTDGKGPISEIDLSGTNPSKSVVSITIKKPKVGASDGRVQIGEIDGTGVKSLSLLKADLDGAIGNGINLTSFLGSLNIGAIRNGADITLSGVPPKAHRTTKISAGAIGDGTDIAITGAPLGNLTATSIGVGTIAAPSVGSIIITGKRKTKAAPAISGNFRSNLTIAGTGLAAKVPALRSLKVAGSVAGSTILVGGLAGTIGDVGRVSVGSFVNSQLFAGYSGPDDGSGTFNLSATVGSFTVTGSTTAFAHSFVIASNFRHVLLNSVDPNNSGTKFGFVFHTSLKALSVKIPSFLYDPKGPAIQDMPLSDFEVRKV